MVNRHHNTKIVGLGALLGLWTLGCHSGPSLSRSRSPQTNAARTAVATSNRGSLGQAVHLLRPQRTVATTGWQTVAATGGRSPIIRAAAEDVGGNVVVASSWRPLARSGEEAPPLASGYLVRTSLPREMPVGTAEPERLTIMPRTVAAPGTGNMVPVYPAGSVPHDYGHGPGPGPGASIPREGNKAALPAYRIEPPDILLIQLFKTGAGVPQPIDGQHLVRPDGTVNLGTYGSLRLGGLTLDEARYEILRLLSGTIKKLKLEEINVDVIAYNSKVYYVITDGAGYGEQVYRLPITGSETVLDALGLVGGLPPVASKKKIWVARANLGHAHANEVLPVNWIAITQHGSTATNYQLAPGDRVYVCSQTLLRTDSLIGKIVNPINRLLGTVLLGSATVNSIKGVGTGAGATPGTIR